MSHNPEPSNSEVSPSTHSLEQFDWMHNESVCAAVVQAVAAVSDTSPTNLPPLYETINTDALDALLEAERQTAADATIDVSFRYDDYEVVVSSDGDGHVREPASDVVG